MEVFLVASCSESKYVLVLHVLINVLFSRSILLAVADPGLHHREGQDLGSLQGEKDRERGATADTDLGPRQVETIFFQLQLQIKEREIQKQSKQTEQNKMVQIQVQSKGTEENKVQIQEREIVVHHLIEAQPI